MEIVPLVIAAAAVFLLAKSVKIIGQAEVMVIERLGRFHRVARSGLNILIPLIERPKSLDVRFFESDVSGMKKITSGSTTRIDLREQVLNFPSQPVITKDNVTIDIDAVLYYRVADPQKATYSVQNLPYALETLTRTTLRNIVGEMELDATLTSRDVINRRMREVIEDASIGWGVDVTRVELQSIEPPRDIQQSMELQMRAERERRAAVTNAEATKRAAILEAEGVRESQVLRAEGERDASVLRAQGLADARLAMANAEAEAIKLIAASLPEGQASTYLLGQKYLDAPLPAISQGKGTTIFLPAEATGMLGALGGLREMLRAQGGESSGDDKRKSTPALPEALRAPWAPDRSTRPRPRRPVEETISRERAELIARAEACSHCREYSFKKISVKAAPESHRAELRAVWIARRVCGVCGLETEMGLDAEGDIVFLGLEVGPPRHLHTMASSSFDIARALVGDRVQHEFLVVEREEKKQANGDPFVLLTLGNASGRLGTSPIWSNQLKWASGAERGKVVQVIGEIALFHGKRQLRLTAPLRVLPDAAVRPEQFLPRITVAPETLWEWIDRVRGELKSVALRRVVDLFFADDAFREQFERSPASVAGHHAAVGGLLLHVTEVATIARNSARVMKANADLVVVGALLHDIGKVRAYDITPTGFSHTTEGSLLGHVVLGALMLQERLAEVPPGELAASQRLELLHLILSHHGSLEFGSPVQPMTVEAELLHWADETSAKANDMGESLAEDEHFGAGEVSERRPWRVGRRVWRRPHGWD